MLAKILHMMAVFATLLTVWYVFSGVFTPPFFIFAFTSCLIISLITRKMEVIDRESHPFQLIYLGPVYWSWLAKEMLVSGVRVTRIIWQRELKLTPDSAWVEMHLSSDLGRAIYANSLTLTPGTVCVDIEKDRAYIHALEKTSLDEMELGDLERRVERVSAYKRIVG